MENFSLTLPNGFLFDITNIAGSSNEVCIKTIKHYYSFIEHPNPIVQQIAKAMVGNLHEYYNVSYPGTSQFQLALPHLSDVANFMDSKNSPNMDIQSTARIKSFYSAYEKLLSSCANSLEHDRPIPTHGFAKDLIATRDILYPRYQFRNDPQAFYKCTYSTILDFMEYIEQLSQQDPQYGFEPVSHQKQQELMKPKKYNFPEDEIIHVPDKDFLAYALELKGIPNIYRDLATISTKLDPEIIIRDIQKIQSGQIDNIYDLPIMQVLQNEVKKDSLTEFRNLLEQEFLDNIPANSTMLKDYKAENLDDFLYLYKLTLKPQYKDYLAIISHIDSAFKEGNYPTYLAESLIGGNVTQQAIDNKFEIINSKQNQKREQILADIQSLDLNDFDKNLATAKKLQYFASCSKDYMKNPKEAGYQSFHVVVRTPFGRYEKQFRTQEQHYFAEYGHASHNNSYKPYEKENFHRLKVCTPLMPKRNEEKDIILPIQLEPVSLEEAIKEYYHKDFSFFSGGLSMQEFQKEHPDDFDDAMLHLSQPNEKLMERVSTGFSFLKKIKNIIIPKSNDYNPFDNR